MTGVISKAIVILDFLLPQGIEKEASVTEISKELDMPVQSVHRILSSLMEHGFVAQDAKTRKYKLGLSIMKYGFLMWDSLMLRSIARPFMHELGERTKETVYLAARENDEGVYVDCVDSPQILKISEPIGLKLPLYIGASNRAIMAHLPQKTRDAILKDVRWDAIPSLKPMTRAFVEEDMAAIRERGYAVSVEEATEGTIGIGVPIFSYENIVIGSLNVAGPTARFGEEQIARHSLLAVKYAKKISSELGFRGRRDRMP
ncbi:IclR family transcriptional regulator [Paenibacillus arenilitoris]|uniref:IclR family transcriptional regulator n=1 Tax=Paenibacillus arenilitoris TaxID=2772299 RepID=A0A927CFK2_9BACL|nr:IclR family transcriptional regulator [Paenibacillus arenilitoris]MBD2867164.1 IclR family transcriptional regulator [Paenibacillus arenilitoris]